MKVPDHWWPSFTGNALWEGHIHSINFDADGARYFQLELDDEKGALYPMRYDAVLHYVDEDQSNFASYQLPDDPLANPAGETVRVRQRNRPIPENSLESESESEGDDNGEEEDEENDAIYQRTDPADWKKIGGRNPGRDVEPIPFTGETELFTVNISEEELESLKDINGDIRYSKVFEWLLPRYGEDGEVSFWEFLAARMRNYMIHIMRTKGYKPKYYNPTPVEECNKVTIDADHVARFFGCQMARMLRGFPSIEETWSTRESLDAVGSVKDCMPQDAFKDIHRCMHFSDDWELEEDETWEDIYPDAQHEPSSDVAKHRRKFEHIEHGFNERWKACVNFGKWMTADESRVAGWYRSGITIGPEPKPIRTGATLHSLCVTKGPLATYKLHVRVYGGKSDEDLDQTHHNTASTQKWVNLYSEMLDAFKGEGHGCTMDSAYMGDIMAQIGRHVWKFNFIGTAQNNRTGAPAEEDKKSMRKGTYESILYQHNTEPLCFAMW